MAYEWKEDNSVKFINPYNFVPLGKVCAKIEKSLADSEKLVTGRIECEITPKTDLFVPNTSSDNAFNTYSSQEKEEERHKSYDFFSYINLADKEIDEIPEKPKSPIIPGSEIRGVMRSVYETLTDSCLNMDYDKTIFTRTPNIKQPGILKFNSATNEWELYKADNVRFDPGPASTLKTGDIAKFKVLQRVGSYAYSVYGNAVKSGSNPINNRGLRSNLVANPSNPRQNITQNDVYGIVLIGEKGARKEHEHIFYGYNDYRDGNGNGAIGAGKKVKDGIEKLRRVLELYRDKTVNQHYKDGTHKGYEGYNISLETRTPYPVYYEYKKDKYYFSPACISKNVYYKTLGDMVKDYHTCDDINKLCPACRLFGTVSESENNFAVSSRLRFSDAVYCGEADPEYRAAKAINELANPKFKCFEFYMTNPENNLKEAFDIEGDDVTIKGRKFYLHHTNYQYADGCSNLNCTIRPLVANENAKFKFNVFFDKVSESELQKLLAVLSNGGNENDLCHKLGKAKPLGFGSAKIKVNAILVRNIKSKDFAEDKTSDYSDYFSGKKTLNEIFKQTDGNVINSYKIVADFNSAKGKIVSYPQAENLEETDKDIFDVSYQWFIGNRRLGEDKRRLKERDRKAGEMNWIVRYQLPNILDKTGSKNKLELPKLKKIQVPAYNNPGNRR